MTIDFTPMKENPDVKYIDLWRSQQLSLDDLRAATNDSIDYMLNLIEDLTDDDLTFDPIDPEAHDPEAIEGEENIGWNLAHLIAHVTASSEEDAAFASLLARGVEDVKDRPRYETPWRDLKTREQVIQRLEESRRIRLAYLNTFPDKPDYQNKRVAKSERFQAYFGDLNAPASVIKGLSHEVGHYDQMHNVKLQALEARQQA